MRKNIRYADALRLGWIKPPVRPVQPNQPIMLTLPYPVSANRYWKNWRGRMRLSPEAKAYKLIVAGIAAAAGVREIEGDVEVRVKIYRPQKSGDLDNRLKTGIDALRGIAYRDDKQIVKIVAIRRDDKANPRAEFEILPYVDPLENSVR